MDQTRIQRVLIEMAFTGPEGKDETQIQGDDEIPP